MKKHEAIALFTNQLIKLDITAVDDVWVSQTASMVREFLGEESDEYLWIKNYKSSWISSHETLETVKRRDKNRAVRFIEGCEDAISLKGFYKKPKENFLNRWGSKDVVGMLFVYTSLIGGACFWAGTVSSQRTVEKLEDQIQVYQEQQDEFNQQILTFPDSLGN